MTKQILALIPFLLAAAPAAAQSFELLGEMHHSDYSDGMGERTEGRVVASSDFGAATVVLEGKLGERRYDAEAFTGASGGVDVYYDWSDVLTTRTTATFATDDPVFVNRLLGQEVMIKPVRNLVLGAGISFRRYFGKVDATTYSAGPSYYFDRGFVRYGYTHYDTDSRGNTHSHLATIRLNDHTGGGHTQAWVGTGTSLQEYEFVVPVDEGDVTGVSLRRVQPLNRTLSLTLAAERQWYETPLLDYTRWGVTAGLQVGW